MKPYTLLCLLVLFCFSCYAQDPTTTPLPWNGDVELCTVDPSAQPGPPPNLKFPNQAEFTLERVEIKHILDSTLPSEMSIYQYLYDYDANKLILVTNQNNVIDTEFFYYNILKKSTYYRGQFCTVSDIGTNIDTDGRTAIQLMDGSWHIRPLNEFLLFSSNDPRRPFISPVLKAQGVMIRGIPCDVWESCIVNRTTRQTVKRSWAFASQGVNLPAGTVGDLAVPIQANISESITFDNGTEAIRVDEVYNVYNYRPGIVETSDQLAPPKGVFCDSGSDQNLKSLEDIGIWWPRRFSVRVEASSSRSSLWQRFHLRYDRGYGENSKRLRYDYMPPGASDYHSVIHDYGNNLTYNIDRQTGSCRIYRILHRRDINPIIDPIEFFAKYEEQALFHSADKVWEYNGVRTCRGDTVRCAIATSSIDNFPTIVDSDTGVSSGENWAATNVEYGWTARAPNARPSPNRPKHFDYPVYLFLRMYRFGGSGEQIPSNIRTEDIEYEFYEMSHESHPEDFDTSMCYRALKLEYLHMFFFLKLSDGAFADDNHLDGTALEYEVHRTLANVMQVKYARITGIEVDHEEDTGDVTVHFTLLGPTPNPDSPTWVTEGEPTAESARAILENSINGGNFRFSLNTTDNVSTIVTFQGVSSSLKSSKQYQSHHAVGRASSKKEYSSGAVAGAVIGGLLVGIIVGIIVAAAIRIVRKEPMPSLPTSMSNPLPNISFYNKKTPGETPSSTGATNT